VDGHGRAIRLTGGAGSRAADDDRASSSRAATMTTADHSPQDYVTRSSLVVTLGVAGALFVAGWPVVLALHR
jgi:hypothetical protein